LKNEISAPVIGGNHLTLAVSNIERSFIFYRDVLGFKPLCRWHAGAYFIAVELYLV